LNHNFDDESADGMVEEATEARASADPALFNILKDLCRKEGKTHNLPPYVIFQETSLEDMATKYPINYGGAHPYYRCEQRKSRALWQKVCGGD
jgi:superfamily II DNA helicase RecQ